MNLNAFLERRKQATLNQIPDRGLCLHCRQPTVGCFCKLLRRFNPRMKFILLIHPIEVRRRIATGRMAHLCLENSELLVGEDFASNKRVNALLRDTKNECVVLYPHKNAIDIDRLTIHEQRLRFSVKRDLVIFVIDGTWATARKTIRSENLAGLPKICFTPSRPSTFRVRKQPAAGFYSTIEAVHQCIEILGESRDFDLTGKKQQALLDAFDWMVERQMMFSPIHNPARALGHHAICKNAKTTSRIAARSQSKP